jgi:hypothetical protein
VNGGADRLRIVHAPTVIIERHDGDVVRELRGLLDEAARVLDRGGALVVDA